MKDEVQNDAHAEEHAGQQGERNCRSERRAEFRVSDEQRAGRGAQTAWSRMAMIERRKRIWVDIRRWDDEEYGPSDE